MEQEKKKNKGTIIVIIILVIALLGTISYIVWDKVLTKKAAQKETTETKERIVELDPEDDEIEDLYKTLTSGIGSYCGIYDYFTDQKVTTSDLSNELVYTVAVKSLNLKTESEMNEKGKIISKGDSFTKSQLETKIAKIYGEDYHFTNQTYTTCPQYNYNSSTKIYDYIGSECGGTCGPTNMTKIERAEERGKKLELYIRILFVGDMSDTTISYYKDYNKTEILSNLEKDEYDMPKQTEENMKQGSLYKMTFTKEQENYVFTSSELVEE